MRTGAVPLIATNITEAEWTRLVRDAGAGTPHQTDSKCPFRWTPVTALRTLLLSRVSLGSMNGSLERCGVASAVSPARKPLGSTPWDRGRRHT